MAKNLSVSFLPPQKQQLLEYLVDRLSSIEGMLAVVLGGSYAGGTFHEASDMDIGLYYEEASPFSIDDVRDVALEVAEDGNATVTGFYEWGAWVNGCAWIHTPQGKVDFLYRNLDQVQRTIEEAQQGIVHHDYDQQPAYGFYSVIYLAETQICIPLYDPENRIARLKREVSPVEAKGDCRFALVGGVYAFTCARLCRSGGCVQHRGVPDPSRIQPDASAFCA